MISKIATPAAAIQFTPKNDVLEENLAVAQQLAFEALAKGARVVVLPELCISGKNLNSEREAAVFAQEVDGYQSLMFTELARRYNAYIAFGYVELSEAVLYNSIVLIGPSGPMANYRKKTLDGSDFLWATKGDVDPPILYTNYGRIGMLLGDDVSNKIVVRSSLMKTTKELYAYGSVDIMCCATSVLGDNTTLPDSSWVSLCENVGCNVIISNAILSNNGGGSCIVDKNMHVWISEDSWEDYSVVGGVLVP